MSTKIEYLDIPIAPPKPLIDRPPQESARAAQAVRAGRNTPNSNSIGSRAPSAWKGRYNISPSAIRPALPDISWLRPTKWKYFSPTDDLAITLASDKERDDNKDKIKRELVLFIPFYDKDQWGRGLSGLKPAVDRYPTWQCADRDAKITELYRQGITRRVVQGVRRKRPTYFRFEQESYANCNDDDIVRTARGCSTVGDQEMLSEACLWLILTVDNYSEIPIGKLLRSLIGKRIKQRLSDLIESERENHSDSWNCLCASCDGTGAQGNSQCADCKGKGRKKIYQPNHDFIDACTPIIDEGDQEPYPLQDHQPNAEQRLVVLATRATESMRVAVRTAVSGLSKELATEVLAACRSDRPIPRESRSALRGLFTGVEMILPCGGAKTVERYFCARFRKVKVSKAVITSCRNQSWWTYALARHAEDHGGWPEEVVRRTKRWVSALAGAPIGEPPVRLDSR